MDVTNVMNVTDVTNVMNVTIVMILTDVTNVAKSCQDADFLASYYNHIRQRKIAMVVALYFQKEPAYFAS